MNCQDCGKEANDTDYWSALFMAGWEYRCKRCFTILQKGRTAPKAITKSTPKRQHGTKRTATGRKRPIGKVGDGKTGSQKAVRISGTKGRQESPKSKKEKEPPK